MDTIEKSKKLQTLPWQALHDVAVKKGIDEKEVNGRDKGLIIQTILSYGVLTEEEIEELVNDYVYGDRVSFTLWTFHKGLTEIDFSTIYFLENNEEDILPISGYRKLKILSAKDFDDRIEVLYVYSKEYTYIDESGKNAGIWEQHRGCLWVGKESTYLACISKHEKMTSFITKYIAEKISNTAVQIKPPKSAIDKCTNSKAISRIVLQGKSGEKTVVSRAGGITFEQEEEIERIRSGRIDTSGSFIAEITDDIDATVKYNVRNGSIGIYKHLPAHVLFQWSETAIKIILQEIEELRGKPAEEIFREVGQEIKWNGISSLEGSQLNWYLTQIITSLGKIDFSVQIPVDKLSILDNGRFFTKLPRLYCKKCESYEIPYCANCGRELKFEASGVEECDCGMPIKIKCSEGHESCEIENWYLPKDILTNMIKKNIRKVYKDYNLSYNVCIIGDILNISGEEQIHTGIEVPFNMIECFKNDPCEFSQRIKAYAVNLKEKCGDGTCSYKKIQECMQSKDMICLPKTFYSILPSYRPQPHKGKEYGDIAAEVDIAGKSFELKGIIKSNSKNGRNKNVEDSEKIQTPLLASSKEGQEIIRQFVEQGLEDARCEIIAVVVPQYIDADFKGTLKFLAKLGGKKVTFIELDEVCSLLSRNEMIKVS